MKHTPILFALLFGAGTAFAQSDGGSGLQELPAAAQSMEGFSEVAFDDLAPEDLTGAMLYGAEGDEIGPVSSVVPMDGAVGDVIVDVGDLINLGETPLAFQPMDMVALRSEEGELRLVSRMTREDVEAVGATAGN